MKPGLRMPCTFILIFFKWSDAYVFFFLWMMSRYIVLRAVCCTKECRSLCKYMSDHLHLFTMSFFSLICTPSVLFHLIHSIALSVSFRIKQTETLTICVLLRFLHLPSTSWPTPPSCFSFPDQILPFAPCCSIITVVEFHFCSNGLQHILKSGLSTSLTGVPGWQQGLSFLCAARAQSNGQEAFLAMCRYTKFLALGCCFTVLHWQVKAVNKRSRNTVDQNVKNNTLCH